MSVGFGIIGLGNMARRVASAVATTPDARLAAVLSRDPVKAQAFADEHAVPGAFHDLDAFLADPAVDVVYVATPNAHHAPHSLAALHAGKHVLVEKPMALSTADAEAMVAAAGAAGLLLGTGFHLRFHPVHVEIQRLIAAGRIGTPTFVEGMFGTMANMQPGSWALDPALARHGSLSGLGVHLIDLLPWLTGAPIAAVAAMNDGPTSSDPVEFLTSAVLRFEGGAHGALTCSRRLPNADNSVRVYGTEGLLEGVGTIGMDATGVLRETHGGEATVHELPLEDLYALEIRAFVAALAGTAPFGPDGAAGARSVAVTEAIADAAGTGRTIQLDARYRCDATTMEHGS